MNSSGILDSHWPDLPERGSSSGRASSSIWPPSNSARAGFVSVAQTREPDARGSPLSVAPVGINSARKLQVHVLETLNCFKCLVAIRGTSSFISASFGCVTLSDVLLFEFDFK